MMALQPFKPWKSFAEQVQLLEQRGMIFNDKQQAEKELARIGAIGIHLGDICYFHNPNLKPALAVIIL
ncbi:hypothetical protein [Wielerella bovis]|uniref:hypothetical protein n=1 Tax=Wielerella bovis TaxID=2917790 RepID=UPI00201A006B|nr:hypothetical protein [Wielerella bovis]ULJ60331.1 hypothetical protein MIS44_00045 [Wielerella bovis]